MNATQPGHKAAHDTRTPVRTPAQTREPATGADAGTQPTDRAPGRRRSRPRKGLRAAEGRPPGGLPTPAPPAPARPSPATTRPPGTEPADVRRRALGRYGEDLAARRLIEAGMRILDRNWRCREGEIDIVAADGDAVVVCEVKTRRAGRYEHPMAAVRPQKIARLRLLAERWLERHGGPPPGGVRIDVIGVLLPARGAPVVQHARGVA